MMVTVLTKLAFFKFVSVVCVKGLQQFLNLPEMPYVALVKMLDILSFASLNTWYRGK